MTCFPGGFDSEGHRREPATPPEELKPAECPAIFYQSPPRVHIFFGRVYEKKYWTNCDTEEDFRVHISGIIEHHKQREVGRVNTKPEAALLSPDHRARLVNFIFAIVCKSAMLSETLFTAVYMLDCHLQHSGSLHSQVNQMTGTAALTCLFLAAKTEETRYIPTVDIASMGRRCWKWGWTSFSKRDMLDLEIPILRDCRWDAWMPQPLEFLRMFNALVPRTLVSDESYILSRYLLDMSLFYAQQMLVHEPSVRAAACIHCSRVICQLDPDWPLEYEKVTGHPQTDIVPLSMKLAFIYDIEKHAEDKHETYIAYSRPENMCVASKFDISSATVMECQGEGYTPPAVKMDVKL